MRSGNTVPLLPAEQTDAVPLRYRGVWQRTLLGTGDMNDTTSTVFWLQTARWHADIRIPAQRPDFSTVDGIAACSPAQLAWLASQQGFAGVTKVDTTLPKETCRWHRLIDFQPPGTVEDVGHMMFEPTRLVEKGVQADYLEHWCRLPDSDNGFAVLRRVTAEEPLAAPDEFLMVAGRYVMHVRDRASAWPPAIRPGATLSELVRPEHAGWLDLEISFGERTGSGWRIRHSTLPWREGESVDLRMNRVEESFVTMLWNGVPARWRIIEWSPPG